MARRKRTNGGNQPNLTDYRHDSATRKNNPSARIAAEGTVPTIPKAQYRYSPRRPPVLRFALDGVEQSLPRFERPGGMIDEERFAALSGTVSLPFAPGKYKGAAVKVIDPRGNEVMKVHKLR